MSDLTISGLTLKYGNSVAVRDASLTVGAGEFVTLLGPSGSGKTSILRAVAGYIFPSEGTIKLRGAEIGRLPARMRNCGMVFQNYALFPHLTVRGNVAYGLKVRKVPKAEITERVDEMLGVVGLSSLGERYPHQLSGGQQQRVALARALVIQPDLLLMDEPLSALDRQLRDRMQDEIRSLQQRFAISTIYVTHDQSEALAMSDRIAVVNEGRIVADGDPLELFTRPPSSFVASFLGHNTLFEVPDPKSDTVLPSLPGQRGNFRFGKRLKTETERVFVSLPPQAISCSRSLTEVAAQGRVRSRRFIGNTILLIVDVKGQDMFALDTNGDIKAGETIYVHWDSSQARVIEETADGVAVPSDNFLEDISVTSVP